MESLYNAIKSNILYLEIDTRVSRDGVLYVNHDAQYNSIDNKKINISKSNSSYIDSNPHKKGYFILKLDELLKVFANRQNKEQKLLIDIKDYGFEKEHINLVNKYNLGNNIIWVSWIPQTLIKLHKISPNTPKVLSYMPLNRFKIINTIIQKIKIIKIPFTNIVLIGKNSFDIDLKHYYNLGYQHAYICKEIDAYILNILKESKGGICIQKEHYSKDIKAICIKNNIALLLFTINTKQEYNKISNIKANILFSDTLIFNKRFSPYSHTNN